MPQIETEMTESGSCRSELQELKRRSLLLAEAVGNYLGAQMAEVISDQDDINTSRRSADALRQRKINDARNRASQLLTEHAASVLESVARSLAPASDPATDMLAAAEYLHVGDYSLQGPAGEPARNLSVKVPAVVPFLNHCNLVLRHRAQRDAVVAFMRTLILDALVRTAPGQLIVHFFDPHLRGAGAPFAALRNVHAELLPEPLVNSEDLDGLFEDVSRSISRIAEYGRGRDVTLGQLRDECHQPIESYEIIVLQDYPSGLDERLHARLARLMESGPRCGISFCIEFDNSTSVHDLEVIDRASRLTNLIDLDENVLYSAPFSGLPLIPKPALPIEELLQEVSDVVARVRQANLPSIQFSEVHADIEPWNCSSVDGITAIIGKTGIDNLTITLGDERTQRHNVLISGAVGQGKSNLLMTLVHSIAWQYPPEEVEMYLLDLKEGLTLSVLASNPQDPSFLPNARVLGLQSDQAFGCAILDELTSEFNRRSEVMRPYGDNIARYRRNQTGERMPRILVVIDEFHKLFDGEENWSDRALKSLVRLAREGRAYGIHLILASQTLSGITALLAQQDGIFAQFPTRLALKNSPTESQVVLGPANNEAARLRFRGEIIVNEETGMAEANRRGIVLDASPSEMTVVRTKLWNSNPTAEPPTVFDGAVPGSLARHLDELQELREASRSDATQHHAVVGVSLSSVPSLVGAPLSLNAGSHLAIVGTSGVNNRSNRRMSDQAESASPDLAIGALLSAAIALAIQHPHRCAEFVILDLLDDGERQQCHLEHVVETLFHFGASAYIRSHSDVSEYVRSMPDIVEERTPDHAPLYVIGLGLDRASLLRTDPISAESAADSLRQVLMLGPQARVHLLAWWASMSSFDSMLGYEAQGTVSNALILGVDQSDLAGLMGPFVRWRFTPNRGLLHLRGLGEPRVMVPMAPPSPEELKELREHEWD